MGTESSCCTLVKTHNFPDMQSFFRRRIILLPEGSPELCITKVSPQTMFCILWGCGSNLTENIAETEAWELVEHAAQFRGAPICETQHFSKFVSFCVAQVRAGNWRKEINIMKRQ